MLRYLCQEFFKQCKRLDKTPSKIVEKYDCNANLFLFLMVLLLSACSAQPLLPSPDLNITQPDYQAQLLLRESHMRASYNRLLYGLDEPSEHGLHPEFLLQIVARQLSGLQHTQANLSKSVADFNTFIATRLQATQQLKVAPKLKHAITVHLQRADINQVIRLLETNTKFVPAASRAAIDHELGWYYLNTFEYITSFSYFQSALEKLPHSQQPSPLETPHRYQQALQHAATRFIEPIKNSEIYMGDLSNTHTNEEIQFITSVLTQIGHHYFEKADYANALNYFTRSLNIKIKTVGLNNPSYIDTWLDKGIALLRQQQLQQASDIAEHAVSGIDEHPVTLKLKTARFIADLGRKWLEQNCPEKSHYFSTQALTLLKPLTKHQHELNFLEHLGSTYFATGQYVKALRVYDAALGLVPGTGHNLY